MCQQKTNFAGTWRSLHLDGRCDNFRPSELFLSSCRSSNEDGKAGPKATRRIPLTKGKFALVDAEDYYQLSQFQWFANGPTQTKFYAIRRYGQKALKMHRVIMNAPEDLFVDHIDHNGLNNCKTNLRLCTRAQNNRNIPPAKGKSSKYKGVGWDKGTKKWRTKIRFNTKLHHIGYFENEIEAAKAYDEKAVELFGEFACLNFPP
jgi:hypothetical protein